MSTLSELQTEVASEIGSINATDDATAINRELNRGVRDILRRTHCYVESETFTPGANENYTLDTTVLEVIDMYFTNATLSLDRVTVAEIHRLRRAVTGTSSSQPRRYAWQNPLVLFEYAPGASDTLTVVNVPAPTAMSAAGNDPATATYGGIPVDYHWLIARYAMRFLASFDDDASSAQGSRYWEEYMSGIADMRRELSRKGGARPMKATLGPVGGRIFPPSDNSTDW